VANPKAKIKWNGSEVLRRQKAAGTRALQHGTEFLLGESRPLVPVEEGELARSGTASVDPGQQKGAVSYDEPYAVDQHESLEYYHDDGQAKYLEEPFMDAGNQATLAKICQTELKRALS
jgi:hypothetical protein